MKSLQKTISILKEPAQYSIYTVMTALKEIQETNEQKIQVT